MLVSIPTLLYCFSLLTKLCTSLNLLISCPLYLSVLHFLRQHRHKAPFNSSFYLLFFALGVVDLSKYCLYLLKKCSYWGWVPSFFLPLDTPNRWAQLHYMSVWALSFAQYQLTLLLSLNRFLSLLWPQMYRRLWKRSLSQCALLFVALSSLGIVLPILEMPVCFRSTPIQLEGENQTLVKLTGPVFMNLADLSTYYLITKCFVFLLLITCVLGYPLCFAKVRKMNLQDHTQAVEARMLYALGLLVLANLLYTAYFIVWEVLIRVQPKFALYAEWSLYLIIDFYDLNSPYGLLLTSKLIRRSVFPFKLWAKPSPPENGNANNGHPLKTSSLEGNENNKEGQRQQRRTRGRGCCWDREMNNQISPAS